MEEEMATAHNLGLFSQVSDRGAYAELRQSLSSQIPVISPAIDQTLDFIAKLRKADGSEIDIEVALGEALANAVVHGNRERFGKQVFVTCRCTRDGQVSITVQDHGQGFDSDMVPDPSTSWNRLRTSGRGIFLMKALMDEVRFDEKGKVVHMLKRANAESVAEWGTR
jgi:serine/threonine-protein kinase RsbW